MSSALTQLKQDVEEGGRNTRMACRCVQYENLSGVLTFYSPMSQRARTGSCEVPAVLVACAGYQV
ncbi:hypothetical protein GCM10027343_29110 [Noviherbaspirillum agri]